MQQNNAIILFSYSINIYKSIKKNENKKKKQQQTTKQKTARPNDEKKDN